jgi:hypothetical protein
MIIVSIGTINDELFDLWLCLFWMIDVLEINFTCTVTSFTDYSKHSAIKYAVEECAFFDIKTFYLSHIECSDISFEDSSLFD